MARRPHNVTWLGFTPEQIRLLDMVDHVGNNGWARTSQTEALMPILLRDLADRGIPVDRVKQCMADIGYGDRALHQLDRWESKRTTGWFGP